MVDCWEIIRYKCQLKGNRWETIKICFNEEEAETWLRAERKHGVHPCRVIKEEAMMLGNDFALTRR